MDAGKGRELGAEAFALMFLPLKTSAASVA
jgi:hypothetical protein